MNVNQVKIDIQEVFTHLHHYRNIYQQYKNISQTGLLFIWVFFLFMSAFVTKIFNFHEFYNILFLVVVSLIGVKMFPKINNKILSFYFKNINKNFGREIDLYFKYYHIVSESTCDVLHDGSDGNLCQKVVLKSLSQLRD